MALPAPNQTSSLWPYRQTAKPALYGLTAKPNQLSMANQLSVALPPDQTSCLWPNARPNQIDIYGLTAKPNQLWPYGRQTKPELTDYGLTARPDHLSVALPPVQTGSRRSLHLTGKRNRAGGGLDQGPAPNGAWRNSVDSFHQSKTFHRRGSQRFIDAANPQWCHVFF